MARPGVTYVEVARTAQQLVAAGKVPTIEAIRRLLGTGSNSTLGDHLRAWKAQQEQTQQIATKEHLPEELIALLKGLWERVMNQSEDKIQLIQQEAQHEVIKLKQEIQSLQQNNAHWQQQNQKTKQERDGFAHEQAMFQQWLTDAKIEIATLTEKLAGFEQQHYEKQTRIDELHRQNQQAQANLEHYRTASLEQRLADQDRYEQQQKQLEHTIQQVNHELEDIKREKLVYQQQSQQDVFENNSLKLQLDKLNSQHESLTTRFTDTLSELSKKTQDKQHWQEQHRGLSSKYDEQNKLLLELQTQCPALSQQLISVSAELKEIKGQNKQLAHEKWILGQEKSQLEGQLKQLATMI
jgi:DNA repair exonuclease SbcCD ATPase subunit